MRLEVVSVARTDRGRVRPQNEDACLVDADHGLFVVADGMGGHAAGEVASALAVDVLAERLGGASTGGERAESAPLDGRRDADDRGADPGAGEAGAADVARRELADALVEAGRRIHRQSTENPEQRGMGTTATVLLLPGGARWLVGQVGDSRAYLLREGRLQRLTRDQTAFPGSNALAQALGTPRTVEPDLYAGDLRAGDLFLLCSDGLTNMLPDAELRSLLLGAGFGATDRAGGARGAGADGEGAGRGSTRGGDAPTLEAAADALIDAANERGGRDNITVVLTGVREGA